MPRNEQHALDVFGEQLILELELNGALRGLMRRQILTRTLHFEVMKQAPMDRVSKLLDLLRARGDQALRSLCAVLRDELKEPHLAYEMLKCAYHKHEEFFV